MSEQTDKVKDLEDKLNQASIREKAVNDELKTVKEELAWVVSQYNYLLNATFSEMFDTCAKIKARGLDDLMAQRNQQKSAQ